MIEEQTRPLRERTVTSTGDVRSRIRAEIAAIQPLDELEQEHISDVLVWIDSGAELCRRAKPATPPRHLVSYFVLVDGDYLLLVDHKNAGLWLPTGGHVEPGEHPRTTVIRELYEELGIVTSEWGGPPLMVTCTVTIGRTAGHTDVSLWYVLPADRSQSLHFDREEFNAVKWFEFSAVPFRRSDPHLRRFLQKLAASENRRRI